VPAAQAQAVGAMDRLFGATGPREAVWVVKCIEKPDLNLFPDSDRAGLMVETGEN